MRPCSVSAAASSVLAPLWHAIGRLHRQSRQSGVDNFLFRFRPFLLATAAAQTSAPPPARSVAAPLLPCTQQLHLSPLACVRRNSLFLVVWSLLPFFDDAGLISAAAKAEFRISGSLASCRSVADSAALSWARRGSSGSGTGSLVHSAPLLSPLEWPLLLVALTLTNTERGSGSCGERVEADVSCSVGSSSVTIEQALDLD